MYSLRALTMFAFVSVFKFIFPWATRPRSCYFILGPDKKGHSSELLQEVPWRRFDCVFQCNTDDECRYVMFNPDSYQCKLNGDEDGEKPADEREWEYWSSWVLVDEQFYHLSYENCTWAESKRKCSEVNATLAIINSQGKYDAVQKLINSRDLREYVWLGANDAKKEGYWQWTDGQEMIFNKWSSHENQPNDWEGNQDCLAVIYEDRSDFWGWFDNNCYLEAHFLCEKLA